ncbi:MAG: hypothetical protein ACRC0V_03845, partial [Fusobacteriaceae bacterium]
APSKYANTIYRQPTNLITLNTDDSVIFLSPNLTPSGGEVTQTTLRIENNKLYMKNNLPVTMGIDGIWQSDE